MLQKTETARTRGTIEDTLVVLQKTDRDGEGLQMERDYRRLRGVH